MKFEIDFGPKPTALQRVWRFLSGDSQRYGKETIEVPDMAPGELFELPGHIRAEHMHTLKRMDGNATLTDAGQVSGSGVKALLDAKNHWMERAIAAEAKVERLSQDLLNARYQIDLGNRSLNGKSRESRATETEPQSLKIPEPTGRLIDYEIERAMCEERARASKR